MGMANSAAAPSAAGRSSTSTCSWRPHWWSCANSFNGHASAIAGRLARLPGASSRAYCRALLLDAQYMELMVCAFSLTVVTVGLLLLDAYIGSLTIAALLCPSAVPSAAPAQRRFAILVPAYNEEALISPSAFKTPTRLSSATAKWSIPQV